MRITRLLSPLPDVGCVADGLFPTGFLRAPARFLKRRPPEYWAELERQCHIAHGCDPASGCDPEETELGTEAGFTVADRCREQNTPIEDQWAGILSAFDDGELIADLREAAVVAREDSVAALAAAASASVDDIELSRALADLVVTGSAGFAQFQASLPSATEVAVRLASLRPALSEEQRISASTWALNRAFEVAAALRTGFNRDTLGWLAVSAPDDPPHRPVNVPVTRYPQVDLHVAVPSGGTHVGRTIRTRTMIASGDAHVPEPSTPGELSPDPIPSIEPEQRILMFVHGHSSRLEEVESLLDPLLRRGFTVVAMDLPSSGYSQMVDHSLILDGSPQSQPESEPSQFPVLDFMDSFLIEFVRALSGLVGRDVSGQITAVIGGSLGGNMALRLAGKNPLQHPFVANVVPWSAASVWTSVAGTLREVGAEKAAQRAWDAESDAQRRQYFYDVFEFSARLLFVRPQPEYWYRDDGWEPCKSLHIKSARADRQEVYNDTFRRWHWRVAMDQLYFSHRTQRRSRAILSRTLLVAGAGDNYEWSNIHDATRELGVEMLNAPGRLMSVDRTGHSIHVERPEFFAKEIAAFCPPLAPEESRPEQWDPPERLEGSSTSNPVAVLQEDGRVVVFSLNGSSRVQFRREDAAGNWSAWSAIAGGLAAGEGLQSNFAVGLNEAGHLEVFATLDSEAWVGHVWQDGPNGAWRDWDKGNRFSQLIGGAANAVAVADRVGDGPSRLLLALARTTAGRVHVRGQNRLDSWWLNGRDLGESSVTVTGRPAVAANRARSLHVVIRDTSGALRHIYEESPDEWTSAWASFGPVTSDPAIALDAAGHLHVFAAGPSGDLRVVRENAPSTTVPSTRGDWGTWVSLAGSIDTTARPVAIRNAWGQLQLFARWQDGTVRSRRQVSVDGRDWSDWTTVAAESAGSPAVVQRDDGTLSLFVRSVDGSVQHVRQTNNFVQETFERRVSRTRKVRGRIVALCTDSEDWRPRPVEDVIRDIETGAYSYFVDVAGARVENPSRRRCGRKVPANGTRRDARQQLGPSAGLLGNRRCLHNQATRLLVRPLGRRGVDDVGGLPASADPGTDRRSASREAKRAVPLWNAVPKGVREGHEFRIVQRPRNRRRPARPRETRIGGSAARRNPCAAANR